MAKEHDFIRFPELTNKQIEEIGFTSPHFQITEDFKATVTKVKDGDTIQLKMGKRDFEFPLRILEMDSPEIHEEGGKESQEWLAERIEGEDVEIKMTSNRVGKYGRLLGRVVHRGIDMGEMSKIFGFSTTFVARKEQKIPNIHEVLALNLWL